MAKLYISEHLARVTLIWTGTGNMPAVTGISKKVYDLLLKRSLLSLEIKSAHNVHALLSVQKGNQIFLTPILREDLRPRTEGVICEVEDKKVTLQKKKNWDEVEIVAVRLQVRYACRGRVKGIEEKGLDEGCVVEVETAVPCSIS